MFRIFLPLFAMILFAACSSPATSNVSTPTSSATSTVAAQPAIVSPLPPTAARPTATVSVVQPATAPTPAGPEDYVDDRSSPDQLIRSLFNAVNQKQYARAYAYWSPNAQLPSFANFAQGYADTAAVQVNFGTITSEGAAGTIYFGVPTELVTSKTSGATQTYIGCYTVRFPQPGNYGAPPIQPMSIDKGAMNTVPAGGDPQSLLGKACGGQSGLPAITQKTPNPSDISNKQYIDDRSTPESTLRSMFNAINRHEYVRAYSYWNDVPSRLPYDKFEKGYADTVAVQLSIGTVLPGAAAGNLYWNVPVVLAAQTNAGDTQTYVGCYTLHLSQPALQVQPPYHPMGIEKGSLQQVPESVSLGMLSRQPCANP